MPLRPLSRPSGDTLRRFVFEIVTITAGILIALWIDDLRETRREQALVRNAHQQLTREIADNLRDVNGTEASREAHQQTFMDGLQALDTQATGKPAAVMAPLSLNSPSFPRSAWDTAGRTGALALMEYKDVKAYSELYDLQDLVDRAQERYIQRLTEQSAQFLLTIRGERAAASRSDLQAAREQGMALMGAFRTYRELMARLDMHYERAPKSDD